MITATISSVEQRDDWIAVNVEYAGFGKSFIKNYTFAHENDIAATFDDTIQSELKRINDLGNAYALLKAREREKISYIKPK